jgi:hypothetical protein
MWMSASSFSVVFRKVAGGFGLGGFEPLHTGCEVFHYGNDLAYLAVVGFDAFGEVFEGHWSLSFEFNPKCLRAVARRAMGLDQDQTQCGSLSPEPVAEDRGAAGRLRTRRPTTTWPCHHTPAMM